MPERSRPPVVQQADPVRSQVERAVQPATRPHDHVAPLARTVLPAQANNLNTGSCSTSTSTGAASATTTQRETPLQGEARSPVPESRESETLGKFSENFSKLLEIQSKFFENQNSVARPPQQFTEGGKSNISTWLDSVEVYFQAKNVPEKDWARTLITFLGESALTKIRRIRLEINQDYYEF